MGSPEYTFTAAPTPHPYAPPLRPALSRPDSPWYALLGPRRAPRADALRRGPRVIGAPGEWQGVGTVRSTPSALLYRLRIIRELEVDDDADLLASGIRPGQDNVPHGREESRPHTVRTGTPPGRRERPPQLSMRTESPLDVPLRESRLQPRATVGPICHFSQGKRSPLGFLED